MDPETKACMDRVLKLATSSPSPESTTESRPKFIRPTAEETAARVKKQVDSELRGYIPRMFLDAEIEKCAVKSLGFQSVFLTGPAGTGKTYLAAAILKETLRTYFRGETEKRYEACEKVGYPDVYFEPSPVPSWRWTSVPELLLELRGSFRDGSEDSEQKIIDEYSRTGHLILDDLGAEKSSEYTIQSLYLIIDRRYSDLMPTIITSNMSIGEIANTVGDRIASRIAGMCKVIELKGRDRRIGA